MRGITGRVGFVFVAALMLGAAARGQNCTTQAKMTGEARQSMSDAALAIASAIKANDAARLQTMAAPELTANFAATSYLVHSTAAKITGDTLKVTQLYQLDASGRKAGDSAEADFGCALSGSTDEVDFGIGALPPGMYGFAMVEAIGERPWLLALLVQQQGSAWKVAGFYPHAREAAGHDGLWYWTTARADAKADHKWLAWALYGEADQLLRPANFVSSTHLDQLRTERRTNAPSELSDGINAQTPLVVSAKDGAEFHFTDMGSAGTEDGKGLDLVLNYRTDSIADPVAAGARNEAAAKAMLAAHPELRQGFTGVSVFAEAAGQPPFPTELSMSALQ
jgi:hypothetical protein